MLMRSVKEHAIFLMDRQGLIRAWNPGAVRIFGYSREEVLDRQASLLFTPEDVAAGVPGHELEAALKDGVEEDERWHLRKGGLRFWASGSIYPLLGEDGQAGGFVKILRDSTPQRQRAEDLARSERKMEFVLANLKDHAIFLI